VTVAPSSGGHREPHVEAPPPVAPEQQPIAAATGDRPAEALAGHFATDDLE
jgi:hypothetical protein